MDTLTSVGAAQQSLENKKYRLIIQRYPEIHFEGTCGVAFTVKKTSPRMLNAGCKLKPATETIERKNAVSFCVERK